MSTIGSEILRVTLRQVEKQLEEYKGKNTPSAFSLLVKQLEEKKHALELDIRLLENKEAFLEDLIDEEEEVLCSPIRFNGVASEKIKTHFKKFGIILESKF